MTTQTCWMCQVEKDLSEFHSDKSRPLGVDNKCRQCQIKKDRRRMFVNGKEVSKKHPLYKPGRYKTLDDAWSHCEIDDRSREGDVYIIRNMVWENWYKVGKAVNAEDRLNGYQTSSPFRDYVLCYSEHFDDRHQAESEIHRLLEKHPKCHDRKGEWFKTYVPVIQEVMNEYRNQTASVGYRDEQCPQHDLALCNTGC